MMDESVNPTKTRAKEREKKSLVAYEFKENLKDAALVTLFGLAVISVLLVYLAILCAIIYGVVLLWKLLIGVLGVVLGIIICAPISFVVAVLVIAVTKTLLGVVRRRGWLDD